MTTTNQTVMMSHFKEDNSYWLNHAKDTKEWVIITIHKKPAAAIVPVEYLGQIHAIAEGHVSSDKFHDADSYYVNQVRAQGHRIIVTNNGDPVAAIVPVSDLKEPKPCRDCANYNNAMKRHKFSELVELVGHTKCIDREGEERIVNYNSVAPGPCFERKEE